MNCYICREEADGYKPLGDYSHISCPVCGKYKIAGTAVEMIDNRVVSAERMQEWLNTERQRGNKVPMISSKELVFE